MKINSINQLPKEKIIFPLENSREISLFILKDVSTCGESNFYPNVLFFRHDDKQIFNPINELTLSLSGFNPERRIHLSDDFIEVDYNDYFYFIYNTDNYYHFVYDTLPYLISYFELKKKFKNLKLLVNYPNPDSKSFYRFINEFFEILEIKEDDVEIIRNGVKYQNIFISNSFTHDGKSNEPPRKEIYDFFSKIVSKVLEGEYDKTNLPKKIYISRRTDENSDLSNIGTNYTNRRKLVNEVDLVDFVSQMGFVEIFTENLTIKDKIRIFNNSDVIIGPIGGGMVNVLFSKPNSHLICLVSPYFLEINSRFKYSFQNVKVDYFSETWHEEFSDFKKFMRISFDDKIGEIVDIIGEQLLVNYSDNLVSGWNNKSEFKQIKLSKNSCKPIDNGLNSSWVMNLESFKLKYIDL